MNGESEIEFAIHSVYYNDYGTPNGYGPEQTVIGDSVKSVKWNLNRMKEAAKKPVLWSGDKFPEIYEQQIKNKEKNE